MTVIQSLINQANRPAKFTSGGKFGAATSGTKVANYTAILTGASNFSSSQLALQAKAALVGAGWNVYSVVVTSASSIIHNLRIAMVAGCDQSVANMIGWASQLQSTLNANGFPGSVIYSGSTECIKDVSTAASSPAAQGQMHPGSISGGTYTVQRGDTLSKIAAKTGMSVSALAALNGISNVNLISVGQILRISGTAAAAHTNANTNSGNVNASSNSNSDYSIPAPSDKNWFDKTFFDGAGALTATGIAILAIGAVVLVTSKK